jgi:hypothetical protein
MRASARTPHVRVDAFCGWRFEGGTEVSSSAWTGLCPRGHMVASAWTRLCPRGPKCVCADASVLPPGNFITDATVRLSHGRPSGHRPTVRSSVRPLSSA